MEDLPEADKIALEKDLEKEMVVTRRRKLASFQKTCARVIKKTHLHNSLPRQVISVV
jgi:hypothetical protein